MYAERPSRLVPGAVVWTVDATVADGRVLPDGCMDLLWSGGRLLVAGPDTTAHATAPVPAGRPVSGVRLPPGTAPVVLGVPADELRDQRPDLAAVWGDRVTRAWNDVASDEGPAGQERLLAGLLAERGGRPREVAVAARMVAAGRSAEDVADALGVTTRTLHRRSLAAFGYGPRTLGRVLRLQRVLGLLDDGLPLAEVAHRAGYADQPHLSREVRALAGVSPAQLAAERRGVGGRG